MDSWIVALRGGNGTLVEGRALFGPPVTAVFDVDLYEFKTATSDEAVRMLLAAAGSLGDGVAAVGIVDTVRTAVAREVVLSAALAAAPGEFLVCGRARELLSAGMVYVRPIARRGWRFPVSTLALAPETPSRAACLAAAATLPPRPALIGRDAEIDALHHAIAPGTVTVLRAAPGMGGGRVLSEAAARAGATVVRVAASTLTDPLASQHALHNLPVDGPAWLVIDPLEASDLPAHAPLDAMRASLPDVSVILRASPDVTLPWGDPDTDVEVGPLAPSECRDLATAILGRADASVIAHLARRGGGCPRALVDALRIAVQHGEIVRDPHDGHWRRQSRQALRPRHPGRPTETPTRMRTAALAPVERRGLQAALHLGEGTDPQALGALLRALFGPPDTVEALRAHGLVDIEDGHVTFSSALAAALPPDATLATRIKALRDHGVPDLVAAASHAPAPGAARALALGARRALAVGDLSAAVRLCVSATEVNPGMYATEVEETRAEVALALGAAVRVAQQGVGLRTPPRRLDPEALHQSADAHAASGDMATATRLRALAALALGDNHPALRLAEVSGTSRDHLVGAIARARGGQATGAVRSALAALSLARRGGDVAGETAALTFLEAMYTALGRDAEAHALGLAARAVASRSLA